MSVETKNVQMKSEKKQEKQVMQTTQMWTWEQVSKQVHTCQVHWFDIGMYNRYYVLINNQSEIVHVFPSDQVYQLLQTQNPILEQPATSLLRLDAPFQFHPRNVHVSRHGQRAMEKQDVLLLFAESRSVTTWWLKDFNRHVKRLLGALKSTRYKMMMTTSVKVDIATTLIRAEQICKQQVQVSFVLSQPIVASFYAQELRNNCTTWQDMLNFAAKYTFYYDQDGVTDFQVLAQLVLRQVGLAVLFQYAWVLVLHSTTLVQYFRKCPSASPSSTSSTSSTSTCSFNCSEEIKLLEHTNQIWLALIDRLLLHGRVYVNKPDCHFIQHARRHFL